MNAAAINQFYLSGLGEKLLLGLRTGLILLLSLLLLLLRRLLPSRSDLDFLSRLRLLLRLENKCRWNHFQIGHTKEHVKRPHNLSNIYTNTYSQTRTYSYNKNIYLQEFCKFCCGVQYFCYCSWSLIQQMN